MSDLFEVRASALGAYAEGQRLPAPLAKMGLPAVLSKWDHLALMGRMFNLKQTTIGTALAGATADAASIVLTVPWLRFTVPSGLVVFPRRLNLAYAACAGTVSEIAWIYTNTDSYTSGGTALTPQNWRTVGGLTSSVTNVYVGPSGGVITEAALGTVRALYQDCIPAAFAANATDQYALNVRIEDFVPIVGPASVLLYFGGVTTTPTGYVSMDWAEVPSTVL